MPIQAAANKLKRELEEEKEVVNVEAVSVSVIKEEVDLTAKVGQFKTMMTGRDSNPLDLTNGPQYNLVGNKYAFDNTQYFYYTVKLNYRTLAYEVLNTYGQRLGTNIPIKWYEYVNPTQ